MKRKWLEEAIACASYALPNLSSRRACLLTPPRIDHYKAGKLSANVRSKAHPKGEIRAPLQGNAGAKVSR